jgi:hypothetical protein
LFQRDVYNHCREIQLPKLLEHNPPHKYDDNIGLGQKSIISPISGRPEHKFR